MIKDATTVGSSTYEKIKHDIIFGIIAPGTKLKLGTLKNNYDASVSTLREMLNRLSSDGFVKAEEQRGFFVTDVSRKDLEEITNLRVLLECNALRYSIENGNTEWEAKVVAAHHKLHAMEKRVLEGNKDDIEMWKRYDGEFHLATIEACNNENLLKLHSTIYDKYLRYQMLVLTYRGQSAIDEHHEIFQAVLSRDADKAVQILTDHILNGQKDTIVKLPE
jgi:DNA-binding GntR family transcriptional regulator